MAPTSTVIVAAYGNHYLTHRLVDEVLLQAGDTPLEVVVVDNHNISDPGCDVFSAEGPYVAIGAEHVVRPGSNAGRWMRAYNTGLAYAAETWTDSDSFVLLTNNVELSNHFFAGLRQAWQQSGAGLICPVYNHDWTHLMTGYQGAASRYAARNVDRVVPFADKVCMFVPRSTYQRVGVLDIGLSSRYGWAVDIDYAMRIRRAGLDVRVTELSYLYEHLGATTEWIEPHFFENADSEFRMAMSARYGTNWVGEVWAGFTPPESYRDLVGIRQHQA